MSHYCKICGCYKSNESFSGRGHASHICKKCHKLPVEKRDGILTLNRIYALPFRLSKGNRAWLEKMKSDSRESVRREAEIAWERRFTPKKRLSEEEYDEEEWLSEEFLEEAFGQEPDPTDPPAFADCDAFELPF